MNEWNHVSVVFEYSPKVSSTFSNTYCGGRVDFTSGDTIALGSRLKIGVRRLATDRLLPILCVSDKSSYHSTLC